ncbi:hypothetical protein SCP_1104160 [Sparassis crispa]|uniref:Uncharacterized protein n=1 Tax=Sparassis crispa TaxID=139825 RepID=A0A401H032_9APHY|nr:hypothetical protein SCP_1104160 [Sparassis crispa]GBE87739.1 hypothetical protein SCP_1104160 [Sparassis crispa]
MLRKMASRPRHMYLNIVWSSDGLSLGVLENFTECLQTFELLDGFLDLPGESEPSRTWPHVQSLHLADSITSIAMSHISLAFPNTRSFKCSATCSFAPQSPSHWAYLDEAEAPTCAPLIFPIRRLVLLDSGEEAMLAIVRHTSPVVLICSAFPEFFADVPPVAPDLKYLTIDSPGMNGEVSDIKSMSVLIARSLCTLPLVALSFRYKQRRFSTPIPMPTLKDIAQEVAAELPTLNYIHFDVRISRSKKKRIQQWYYVTLRQDGLAHMRSLNEQESGILKQRLDKLDRT